MSAPRSAYKQALAEAKRLGASRCSDAAVMAVYCEGALQIIVGAASPQLVWEGAQKSGMTARDLTEMAVKDPIAVHELMWL